jgi:hypothetical protein
MDSFIVIRNRLILVILSEVKDLPGAKSFGTSLPQNNKNITEA